jgi:hypothetical protein
MNKFGSSIRKPERSSQPEEFPALDDPSASDPAWIAQRQSMTRVERAAYFLFAAFAFFFAMFFTVGMWMKDKDVDDSYPPILALIGIGSLVLCGYFARKAWLGKRKIPDS